MDRVDEVELVVEDNRHTVVEAVEEANATGDRMTHLRVTSAGCVAIWPVTVPKTDGRRGAVMLYPPKENSLNPGSQAQVEEVENVQFDLVA